MYRLSPFPVGEGRGEGTGPHLTLIGEFDAFAGDGSAASADPAPPPAVRGRRGCLPRRAGDRRSDRHTLFQPCTFWAQRQLLPVMRPVSLPSFTSSCVPISLMPSLSATAGAPARGRGTDGHFRTGIHLSRHRQNPFGAHQLVPVFFAKGFRLLA